MKQQLLTDLTNFYRARPTATDHALREFLVFSKGLNREDARALVNEFRARHPQRQTPRPPEPTPNYCLNPKYINFLDAQGMPIHAGD